MRILSRLSLASCASSTSTAFVRAITSSTLQPKIGLEIHAQVQSDEKLFSVARLRSRSQDDCTQDTHTSSAGLDVGLPGTLPVSPPYGCVLRALALARALGSLPASLLPREHDSSSSSSSLRGHGWMESSFERKHYFYHDLPLGYQITQRIGLRNPSSFSFPVVQGGQVELQSGRVIRIDRVQLEQDTGKTTNVNDNVSRIDLNRSGAALFEIVTHPDFRNSEEISEFVSILQFLLRYYGISDAKMEWGEMRFDVNVSLIDEQTDFQGPRCEVKNVNSMRYAVKAAEYEIARMQTLLREGLPIRSETRAFDPTSEATYHLRFKEHELDYRFLPDPDIPPLRSPYFGWTEDILRSLPPHPSELVSQLQKDFQLTGDEARSLVFRLDGALEYFFQTLKSLSGTTSESSSNTESVPASEICKWMLNDIIGELKQNEASFDSSPLTPQQLARIIRLVSSREISGRSAKTIISHLAQGKDRNSDPFNVARSLDLLQIINRELIEKICLQVIDASPIERQRYQQGNLRMMKHFVGQVMKISNGKMDPILTSSILENLLSKK